MQEQEPTPQNKKRRKGNIFKTLIWVFIGVFLFLFTPLTGFLVSLIPSDIVRDSIAPYYQDITIIDQDKLFDDPLRLDENAPYPVLGRESGICFKFYSTRQNENTHYIPTEILEQAEKSIPIAEIIIMDKDKKQYQLKEVSTSEGNERSETGQRREFSVICQKIGKGTIYRPEEATAIYIRPLTKFRSAQTVWITQKDLY